MIIDADVHIAPKQLFDLLDHCEFKEKYLKNNKVFFNSQMDAYDWSMTNRYKVDKQLLNYYGPSVGLLYNVDARLGVKVMTTYNNYMLELKKEWPRFDINLWLAMQDPDACIDELNRLQDQKFFGVHVGEQIPWGFLPKYQKLFSILEQRQIPLYLHFALSDDIPAGWLDAVPEIYHELKKFWNNPEIDDIKIAMVSLLTQTIPQYPNLRVVIAEHGIHWIEGFCKKLQELNLPDPLPILKTNFWFTCEPESETFLSDAAYIGWDRLLFATDAPHDDIGGMYADKDVDLVQKFLADKSIDAESYSLFTNLNYKKLESRV
jgi:predicted TIM-barrel fold metal-dependent hydrolase